MPYSHLILCHPLLLLPSVFPSIKVFSNQLALRIRWPKYYSFSFSICPSNEYPELVSLGLTGLISFCPRDSQEASLTPQFKSINSTLSFLYGPPLRSIHDFWKNHTFVSKVMALLFSMLSRFVITFLPRSKHVLISWLQWLSAVILEIKKTKSVTVSIFSPSICHEGMG